MKGASRLFIEAEISRLKTLRKPVGDRDDFWRIVGRIEGLRFALLALEGDDDGNGS